MLSEPDHEPVAQVDHHAARTHRADPAGAPRDQGERGHRTHQAQRQQHQPHLHPRHRVPPEVPVAGVVVEERGAGPLVGVPGEQEQHAQGGERGDPDPATVQQREPFPGQMQPEHEERQQAQGPRHAQHLARPQPPDQADRHGDRDDQPVAAQDRGGEPPQDQHREVPQRPVGNHPQHSLLRVAAEHPAVVVEGRLEQQVGHHQGGHQRAEVRSVPGEVPGQVPGDQDERGDVPQVEEVVEPGPGRGRDHSAHRPRVAHHHEADQHHLGAVQPAVAPCGAH